MNDAPVQIIPYLAFRGDCEEALNTYIDAFGGEIMYLSRWPEDTSALQPEAAGRVMHAECLLGTTRMAAGDTFEQPEAALPLKLMVHMNSPEEARHAIDRLAERGTVLSPLKPHPAPDDAGCGSLVKDRFGLTWIITCPNPEKQS